MSGEEMMNMKRWLLWAAMGLALAACQPGGVETPPADNVSVPAETPTPSTDGGTDGGDTGGQADQPQGFQLARSDVERNTAPTVDPTDLGALASGNTGFAFDLYHAVLPTVGSDNLIYSPYSISVAFAMVYAGARGQTEQEIASTLHYTLPQDRLHPSFNALDLELTTEQRPDAQEEGELTLRIANSIWGQSGFNFEQAFLDTLAANYGAGMRRRLRSAGPAHEAINGVGRG
jgi:serpin B